MLFDRNASRNPQLIIFAERSANWHYLKEKCKRFRPSKDAGEGCTIEIAQRPLHQTIRKDTSGT
ncbi:MAG: hypothetical protein Q7V19_04750 [Bacteroidales bacterium]|nr:hypothetical protein [Bacteroidales bacterium]